MNIFRLGPGCAKGVVPGSFSKSKLTGLADSWIPCNAENPAQIARRGFRVQSGNAGKRDRRSATAQAHVLYIQEKIFGNSRKSRGPVVPRGALGQLPEVIHLRFEIPLYPLLNDPA